MGAIGKRWRIGALCTLLAGAGAVAPIVVLNTVASATSAPTQIIYVQKSGQQKTGPFIEYKGASGNTSTQPLSLASSACSTSSSTVSNPSSSPLLPLSASYYSGGYGSSATPASVASALVGRGSSAVAQTGVCYNAATSPGYTIQHNEGLAFSIGQSNLLTQGQLFSEASIPLKNNMRSTVSVDLVLRKANSFDSEKVVETVGPITVPAAGTESEGDTNDCPVVSTGVVPTADEFDQVELQVVSPSTGSVSVIGPSCDSDNDADDQGLPTFTLANAAPLFTSAPSDTVPAGSSGTFTYPVSATGTPTPTFSLSGAPSGVSLTNTSPPTGTATLSGTGVAAGVHTFTIDATNSVGTTAQSFTLNVLTAITQIAPLSGSTTTVASSGFKGQLATSGQDGTVTFTQSTGGTSLSVSSSGAISTAGTLPAGPYTATGTDSDTLGDTGTWTYTLNVSTTTIAQTNPNTGSSTTGASSAFKDQLNTTPGTSIGTITFAQTAGTSLSVSSSGAVSTSGFLAAGPYTASGTDSDTDGDTGTWSYTLNVGATTIAQGGPFTGSSTTVASTGFKDQLTTTGQNSAVTFTQTAGGTSLNVSSTGAITTTGVLAAGPYTASGTDTDTLDDTGTWTYTLNVSATTITQAAPFAGLTTTTSGTFSDELNVASGTSEGGVSFTQTSGATSLTVSSTGAVSENGTLTGGTYTAGGTDADSYGDTGSWTYTLTVDQAPAITSPPNFIVPAPASGGTGTPFSFTVTTTGYPAPTISDGSTEACTTNLPSDISFAPGALGSGTATISGTPAYSDGGVWTVCLDASNGVEPDATQVFTLYVTAPGAPPVLTAEQLNGSPITAGLTLNTGSKSFTGFTTSSSGDVGTVEFDSEGALTETFTATLNIGWDNLTYCVPYSGTAVPVCPPTEVTIPTTEGGTGVGQDVLPCNPASLPTPPAVGWCSQSETYTYVTGPDSTIETNIAEVLYGAGDIVVSHGS
jgi:hypothetical protein